MLNIDEINATIRQLEQSNTTFDTCSKLASLYIVRDKIGVDQNPVEQEVREILPQYERYCSVKRMFQMREIGEQAVFESMAIVCLEVEEFINTLYSSTDTDTERQIIKGMLGNLIYILSK